MNHGNWFWFVFWDNCVPNPYVSSLEDLGGFDENEFARGSKTNGWKGGWIKSNSRKTDGTPDDVLQNHLGLPIFSPRLRQALDDSEVTGIEYLPVEVLRSDGSSLGTFAIANVICVVQALDLERSDYDVFPDTYFAVEDRGRISALRRAVLRAEGLNTFDIIRTKEYKAAIYVSKKIVDLFKVGGFSGASFAPVRLS